MRASTYRLLARVPDRAEKGQGMTEYGLIIAFVALAVFVALTIFGPNISNIFNTAGSSL